MSNINEGIQAIGSWRIELTDKYGNVSVTEKLNIIVNGGFDFLCDSTSKTAGRPAAMEYIGIGSGTTAAAATQTALISQLGRKIAVYAHTNGTKVFTLDVTFNPGEATGAVTEAGIFNAATSGTMLNRSVFPVVNKSITDSLRVVFTLTFA